MTQAEVNTALARYRQATEADYNGKESGKSARRYSADVEVIISDAVDNVIQKSGKLGTPYNNKVSISAFPDDVAMMVSKASVGKIALENKKIAINVDDLWHEFDRHNNV